MVVLGKQKQRDPWGSLSSTLVYKAGSRPVEDPVSKNSKEQKEKRIFFFKKKKGVQHLRSSMHVHIYVCTHICTCMYTRMYTRNTSTGMNIHVHMHKSKGLHLPYCLGLYFPLSLVVYPNFTLLGFVSLGNLVCLSHLQIWGFIRLYNSMTQSLII